MVFLSPTHVVMSGPEQWIYIPHRHRYTTDHTALMLFWSMSYPDVLDIPSVPAYWPYFHTSLLDSLTVCHNVEVSVKGLQGCLPWKQNMWCHRDTRYYYAPPVN